MIFNLNLLHRKSCLNPQLCNNHLCHSSILFYNLWLKLILNRIEVSMKCMLYEKQFIIYLIGRNMVSTNLYYRDKQQQVHLCKTLVFKINISRQTLIFRLVLFLWKVVQHSFSKERLVVSLPTYEDMMHDFRRKMRTWIGKIVFFFFSQLDRGGRGGHVYWHVPIKLWKCCLSL